MFFGFSTLFEVLLLFIFSINRVAMSQLLKKLPLRWIDLLLMMMTKQQSKKNTKTLEREMKKWWWWIGNNKISRFSMVVHDVVVSHSFLKFERNRDKERVSFGTSSLLVFLYLKCIFSSGCKSWCRAGIEKFISCRVNPNLESVKKSSCYNIKCLEKQKENKVSQCRNWKQVRFKGESNRKRKDFEFHVSSYMYLKEDKVLKSKRSASQILQKGQFFSAG
jgi:hypothetical protein